MLHSVFGEKTPKNILALRGNFSWISTRPLGVGGIAQCYDTHGVSARPWVQGQHCTKPTWSNGLLVSHTNQQEIGNYICDTFRENKTVFFILSAKIKFIILIKWFFAKCLFY